MTDVRPDPWQPAAPPAWPYAATPYGQGPGGYPPGPPSAPPAPPRAPGPVQRSTTVVALVASLIGGLIGAGATVVAVRNTDVGSVLDPDAKLGDATLPTQNTELTPVATVAAKLLPSVVSINVSGAEGRGTGSGVVIRSDGYIITNNHVVAGASTIEIVPASGEPVAADLVGRDPDTDIAVIKARQRGLLPATLGRSSTLTVGDTVVAVGSPLGLTGTVTSGIVSALNRRGITNGTVFTNFIQTDAAINPGNSGGALADIHGTVVGINSAIATTGSGGSIGLGFAIPIDEARSVAEEIIRTGRATHPYIGVSARNIDTETSRQFRLPVGAQIMQLVPGGPAERGGLKVSDVIVALGGAKVTSVDDLVVATRQHKIGETVTVTYIRSGARGEAKVVLAEKPPS
jgi:putative serine protease PepD